MRLFSLVVVFLVTVHAQGQPCACDEQRVASNQPACRLGYPSAGCPAFDCINFVCRGDCDTLLYQDKATSDDVDPTCGWWYTRRCSVFGVMAPKLLCNPPVWPNPCTCDGEFVENTGCNRNHSIVILCD